MGWLVILPFLSVFKWIILALTFCSSEPDLLHTFINVLTSCFSANQKNVAQINRTMTICVQKNSTHRLFGIFSDTWVGMFFKKAPVNLTFIVYLNILRFSHIVRIWTQFKWEKNKVTTNNVPPISILYSKQLHI